MREISEKAEAEGRDLTSEETQNYDRLDGAFDALDKRIERMEREEGLVARHGREVVSPVTPAETPEAAVPQTRVAALYDRIMRNGEADAFSELREIANRGIVSTRERAERGDKDAQAVYLASDEYRDAFAAGMKARSLHDLSAEQRAALNVGTGAQGGFLVPTEFLRQLVESERFYGVMRQLATVIVTADNGALSIPKVDDSNRMTAAWTAEAAAFTESEDQFLQATLGAFKQGTISKLSDELILDAAFDVLGFVARSAGQALGILANTAYVTGASGSTTTPEGLFTKATIGRTMPTGNSTSITTADEIFELFHSVRPAYRSRGVFLFSDTLIKQVRQLKASTSGVYIWQPSLSAGDPDTINGRPVYADPDIAVPAANALCGGFGDVSSAYWIRDVQDVTVKILNELYAANGQVGYRTHRRTDGDIVDTLAFKTLKNSAT